MSNPFALCITHAATRPERVQAMARLRERLGIRDIVLDSEDGMSGHATVPGYGRIPYREETTRAANHVWSEHQWRWGAATEADLVLYLQDDVLTDTGEMFFARVQTTRLQMNATLGGTGWMCGLANHPGAKVAYLKGQCGYTTVDGLIGPCYATSSMQLGRMLDWRAQLVLGAAERTSEDVLLALYCMANGLRIYTPVPALVNHDVKLDSMYGHGPGQPREAAYRQSFVTVDDHDIEHLPTRDEVVHLGRFYDTAHHLLPQVLRDAQEGITLARRIDAERCPAGYDRMFNRVLAFEGRPA